MKWIVLTDATHGKHSLLNVSDILYCVETDRGTEVYIRSNNRVIVKESVGTIAEILRKFERWG